MAEEQLQKNGDDTEDGSVQRPSEKNAKVRKRSKTAVKNQAKNASREKDKPKKSSPKKKKQKRSNGILSQGLAVVIVFLAFYLAFSLFVGGLILYSFNDTAENTEIYSLRVIYDDETLYRMDAETANTEYGLYIPFEYLSEIASFGLAGDGDNATLFIIGTDNRIECTKNSSLVIINGNPVRISAPILFQDNEYLIPVVLIENYINGIDVSYDKEEMICAVSSDIGKSDVALKLRLPEALKQPDYFTDEDRYYTDTSDNTIN